ncbi:MAG TPA: acyltransferase family protein [Rhizomicrobium sp.]
MRRRSDIEALRAVAVVPVILFHLGVPGFGGGFVGVDVFFVISGYLITQTMLADSVRGRFSIVRFYERRVRRILQALCIVMAFCYAAALWLFLPVDFKHFSESVVATTLFSSNILFWSETGYFDSTATLKPLLHTWSLAVEEQYYVTFPLVFAALTGANISNRRICLVLAGLALASFALSVAFLQMEQGDVFYLPQYRAWEILLGAILATAALPAPASAAWREGCAAAGLAFIAVSACCYSALTLFPGWSALCPCLGAALVLHAQSEDRGAVGRVLHWPPLVYVGGISYALYLWHWPLIVFTRYYDIGELDLRSGAAIAAATFVLSAVSTRYIERPARRAAASRTTVFLCAAAASAVLLLLGLAGHFASGFPQRFASRSIVSGDDYNLKTCILPRTEPFSHWSASRCTFAAPGKPAAPTVLLWGDSHANHLVPGLVVLQRHGAGFTLIEAAQAGCRPLLDYSEDEGPFCSGFNDGIGAFVRETKPAVVILSARWNKFRDPGYVARKLGEVLSFLHRQRVQVLVIGESPSFAAPAPNIVHILTMRGGDPTAFKSEASFRIDDAIERTAARSGVAYFSPRKLICSNNVCALSKQGQLLFRDESHLSEAGSIFFAKALAGRLRALLKQPVAR